MIDYTISSEEEWNIVALETLTSGDTIKLTASFSFASVNSIINMIDGVTFDGQGFTVTLASGNHEGLLQLPSSSAPDCNIQNIGVNGDNATIVGNWGILVKGRIGAVHGNIYNCYVSGVLTNINSGGIIGYVRNNSKINIERCVFNGTIDGEKVGGIVGILFRITSEINIEECYSLTNYNDSAGEQTGGICGRIQSVCNGCSVNISNCYHYRSSGTYNNLSAGIIGFTNTSGSTGSVTITNCYSINSPISYFIDTNISSFGIINVNINNSIANNMMVDSNGNPISTGGNVSYNNTSTDLTTIEGQLSGPASVWQSTSEPYTWTAGTDTNYPTLDQFTLGPWNPDQYAIYTDPAVLTPNYIGGNTRGSGGGGGGDPHIFPVFGETYDLPHLEETFLLLDNKMDDRLIIKGKCWLVPREIYEKDVETHIEDGISKLEYIDFYNKRNLTFFKYIKIEYNGIEYIFDMDNLEMKEYTNKEDFINGKLPSLNTYKKSGNIVISDPMKIFHHNFSKNYVRKSKFNYSQNAKMREIIIKTKENQVSLSLISDPQNIDLRNSIELTIRSNTMSFYGALIRNEIQIVEF